MRRGQTRPEPVNPNGPAELSVRFSKAELVDASGLSDKSFDTIRKAARVKGPSHGGRKWPFTAADVRALIARAESGSFTERGRPAATAWRALMTEAGLRVD
ncbi:MAG: hypothetical protein ACREJO_02980 [Phycisphaerales bacterium]